MAKIKRLRFRDIPVFFGRKPAIVAMHGTDRQLWEFLGENFACNIESFLDIEQLDMDTGDDYECTVDYLLFSSRSQHNPGGLKVLWRKIVDWDMDPVEMNFKRFCTILKFSLKENEWFVVGTRPDRSYGSGRVRDAFILRVPAFDEKQQRDLEQRLFNELISVPAGRFGRLLPNGGVEYQRQMEQLEQLGCLVGQLN